MTSELYFGATQMTLLNRAKLVCPLRTKFDFNLWIINTPCACFKVQDCSIPPKKITSMRSWHPCTEAVKLRGHKYIEKFLICLTMPRVGNLLGLSARKSVKTMLCWQAKAEAGGWKPYLSRHTGESPCSIASIWGVTLAPWAENWPSALSKTVWCHQGLPHELGVAYFCPMGPDQTGYFTQSRGGPRLLALCPPGRTAESPVLKECFLLGGNFLGVQAWITPSAIWIAWGVIPFQGRGQPPSRW